MFVTYSNDILITMMTFPHPLPPKVLSFRNRSGYQKFLSSLSRPLNFLPIDLPYLVSDLKPQNSPTFPTSQSDILIYFILKSILHMAVYEV